ncbi:MAG: Hsp20/alpha crystallin family protein [Proteobacteria bacterium]|nr:Hsp20/alpha crystallin family protein [Pseudomonadota bacterium]
MTDQVRRSLAVSDPLTEFERLVRRPFGAGNLESLWGTGRGFAPAVDVSENDERYTITAELPGTKKADVSVELHDGILTIRGEKRSEREEQGEYRRHVERSFGTFSRSFSLPTKIDENDVKARFDEGVLTVEIKKAQDAKPRTVAIKG